MKGLIITAERGCEDLAASIFGQFAGLDARRDAYFAAEKARDDARALNWVAEDACRVVDPSLGIMQAWEAAEAFSAQVASMQR